MPHPKNHMKLTGDTHPPELDFDSADADNKLDAPAPEDDAEARVYADGWVPRQATPTNDEARAAWASTVTTSGFQPAAVPWKAIGLSVAVLWLMGKLLRR
jgi:hypothetical protein